MQLRSVCALTATLLTFASCEKASTASGKLNPQESTLMAYLPKDADVVFGGNFMRLQQVLTRASIARARELTEAPALKAWTDCFLKHESVNMLGSFGLGERVEIRFVMTGIKIEDVEHCAKAAGFPAKLDADRKFIMVDAVGPRGPAPQGYLTVRDGVYSKLTVNVGHDSRPVVTTPERAAFEAELAEAANDNAARSPGLQAVVARTDRTKAMWFAGSAANTPIGDKAGELYGSIDFASGLAADVTVEMKSSALATKIVDGLDEARLAAGLLGAEVKSVIDAIELKRDGDRLRFTMKLSHQQLDTVFAKLGPMMR